MCEQTSMCVILAVFLIIEAMRSIWQIFMTGCHFCLGNWHSFYERSLRCKHELKWHGYLDRWIGHSGTLPSSQKARFFLGRKVHHWQRHGPWLPCSTSFRSSIDSDKFLLSPWNCIVLTGSPFASSEYMPACLHICWNSFFLSVSSWHTTYHNTNDMRTSNALLNETNQIVPD